jgi:hypothetical protein
MKQLIKEARRMQQLAGVIKESQLNEVVRAEKVPNVGVSYYELIDEAGDGFFVYKKRNGIFVFPDSSYDPALKQEFTEWCERHNLECRENEDGEMEVRL